MLPQADVIKYLKFDWNFQRFGYKVRVTALLVRNQSVEDFRIGAQSGSGPAARECSLRTGRHRGRIESTAHQDSRTVRSQPVGDGMIQKFPELLDALARPFVMKGAAYRQHPVAVNGDAAVLADEGMCRRQPADIRERSSLGFPDHVEEKKIGNREIIQSSRDGGMPADTIERVAENQDRADASIVKGFNPKLIARTKQFLIGCIPNRKSKITAQMFHARRAPFRVGAEY